MIPLEDFALARDFIFRSTNTGKWNKPHWQAAAVAMAWFIRELPGSPMLMNRVLKIMTDHPDRILAQEKAANLIRAQYGLDASLLTSTQAPTAGQPGTELGTALDVSQIPSAQDMDGAGASGGSRRVLASTGFANGDANETGRTAHPPAPTPTPAAAPAPAAVGDGEAGDARGGDCAAAARSAAPAAAAAAVAAAAAGPPRSQNVNPRRSQNGIKKTGVCSYLWKRMLCRRANCKSSHPDLCASAECVPKRRPDCPKFHGTYKLEEDKNVMGKGRANGGKNKSHQGNGQRGVIPPTRSYSSRNNNSSGRGGAGTRSSNGRTPNDPKRVLEATRKELRVLKGTLGDIMACSTSKRGPSLSSDSNSNNRTYCDVAKSGHVQQLSSFATVFATALETAMSTAGLRLTQTPYVC